MEAVKLKIFDALIEKITVSEFENWLYNSEEFMNQINSNSFYFDVISINYKSDKWGSELNCLAKECLDGDYIEILKITDLILKPIILSEKTNQEIIMRIVLN